MTTAQIQQALKPDQVKTTEELATTTKTGENASWEPNFVALTLPQGSNTNKSAGVNERVADVATRLREIAGNIDLTKLGERLQFMTERFVPDSSTYNGTEAERKGIAGSSDLQMAYSMSTGQPFMKPSEIALQNANGVWNGSPAARAIAFGVPLTRDQRDQLAVATQYDQEMINRQFGRNLDPQIFQSTDASVSDTHQRLREIVTRLRNSETRQSQRTSQGMTLV